MSHDAVFALTDVIPALPTFTIVDVGPAHPATPQRWQGLLDLGAARVVGLEAAATTCAEFGAQASPHHTFLPLAIGDGSERTLYVTANPAYTSLYEPNQAFLRLMQGTDHHFDVVHEEQVHTRRLDDIDPIRSAGCDFLCFDIPGAAFEALTHAPSSLAAALVVQARIHYAPMYRQQPMLGDVDQLLRRHGFVVHRLLNTGGAVLEHAPMGGSQATQLNQDIWVDFVYVRDYTDAASQPAERWIRLGVLAHQLYESYDLAHLAFAHADRRNGGALASRYLATYSAALPS